MRKLYDVAAVEPGGGLYRFGYALPRPLAWAEMQKARARDFAWAVGILLRTGYECYPVVFKLVELHDLVGAAADAAFEGA